MATVAVPAPIMDLRNGDQVTAQAIGSLPAELSDRSDSNPAVAMIEVTGSIFDRLIYQLNRWPQAVIAKCLNLVGVTRRPAAAATVSQSFTLSAPQSADVTIPSGTAVSLADGSLSFATTSDLVIPAYTAQAGTITTTAGSASVTGAGTAFQTGTTWVGWQIQIPASTGPWYTILSVASATTMTLSSTALVAAAAVAFNVGPVTGSVSAQATVAGSATNVGAGKLTTLASSPAGVGSTTNNAAATGGADLETTTAAIARAPTAFAQRDVACSTDDYAAFAVAVLGSGSRCVAAANMNNLAVASGYTTVALLSPRWTTVSSVSAIERAAAVKDLAARTFIGATTIDVAAGITSFIPTVMLYRKSAYDENTVRCNAAAAINAYLNPNTYPWGRTIYLPDLVRVVEVAAGVDRVEEISGVACLAAAAQILTPHAVTFTNGTTSATGTEGDFTNMVPSGTIIIDATNKKAYLVTTISSGTLTITPAFSGASATVAVAWFLTADTALANYYTLPYSNLSTVTATPPSTITVVGAV